MRDFGAKFKKDYRRCPDVLRQHKKYGSFDFLEVKAPAFFYMVISQGGEIITHLFFLLL